MKKLWRSLLRELKLSAMGQRCPTLPKSKFPHLLSQVWNKFLAVAPQNLMSGFRKCDIVPANVEVLLDRLPNKDKLTLISVGEGFQKFVEKRHSDMIEAVGPKRKRKHTNIVAGTNVCSDESSDDTDESDDEIEAVDVTEVLVSNSSSEEESDSELTPEDESTNDPQCGTVANVGNVYEPT